MYTRGANTKTENMAQVADNLAHLIDLPHTSPFQNDDSDLTVRDLKVIFATNDEMMKELLKNIQQKIILAKMIFLFRSTN